MQCDNFERKFKYHKLCNRIVLISNSIHTTPVLTSTLSLVRCTTFSRLFDLCVCRSMKITYLYTRIKLIYQGYGRLTKTNQYFITMTDVNVINNYCAVNTLYTISVLLTGL